MKPTLAELAALLAAGKTTSRTLTEQALAGIDDPAGEGVRTFTSVHRETALAQAQVSDELRAHGIVPSLLAGIPVSVKDLFDIGGETTRAGSRVLADAPPATADADCVMRLRQAGAVIIGRTNMTEFAYSGLGLNPHYGTPKNPHDRATGRIPGGSSSGAAVSVADGMAAVAIGTDTGGSVRIPAALCGLTGFKPTARRIPGRGMLPLSTTLDSIGPIARSVACCAIVDRILSGENDVQVHALPIAGLRLGVVRDYVLNDLDDEVMTAFDDALGRLSAAGARIEDCEFPELNELPAINAGGGFSAAEAWAWHRDLLSRRGAEYDPRVAARIAGGAQMSAADYIELGQQRARMIDAGRRRTEPFDALVMPAVACVAPAIAAVINDDDAYHRANRLILRNPAVVNFIDGCALSIPCQEPGKLPVGLMLADTTLRDGHLLSVGLAIEAALRTEGEN
ncbi:MAG TPA: amidase [Burkholderiales bacterium]|nr:amidase [Burkholderiales bacterium]